MFFGALQVARFTIAWIAALGVSSAVIEDNVPAIVQRSVEANEADWQAALAFNYYEQDRDPTGATKTYQELMILGSPYARLVAVNGTPLPPEGQSAEQHKLEKVIIERQTESAEHRRRRIAAFQKDRERNHLLLQQLTRAFNFKMVGQQRLEAYDVYVLRATPRPGYQPPNMEAQVLTGMEGTLWIEKDSCHWVKVEAEVIHPVSISGFLAKVEPGTRFELEKMPVKDDIWLPRHFSVNSHSKILFLFRHRTQEDQTYSNYTERPPY